MVSVPASGVVDRGFKPQSGQTKNYKIGICCFSDKQTALKRKGKDLFYYKDPIQHVDLTQNGHHHLLIKLTCSRHDMAEKLLIWR
jgi:hypothetical protein